MRGRERLFNKENAAMSKSNVPTGKQHSGGGKTPTRVGQRLGPTSATQVDPRNVAAIGAKRGDHSEYGTARNHQQVPPREMGQMPQAPLGNAKALDVGKGGPGTGRTVYRSGSQAQHGAVAGSVQPQGRDILSEFSPGRKG
jgi:hypothetical protein